MYLPFEPISIWYKGDKIYNNYRSTISIAAYDDQARHYYCSRYGWQRQDFDDINWKAVDKAMSMLSRHTRVWASKFSCGFLGIARMLSRREYWLDNKCPRCGNCDETCQHVIQCPAAAHREQMLRRVDDFNMWMQTQHVDPDMVSDIIMITTSWIQCETVDPATIITPAIQHQYHLGWEHFVMGRLSKSLTVHLHEFYTNKTSRRNAQGVTARIIRWLWTDLIRPAWNDRNACVHRNTYADKSMRLLDDTKTEVAELYNNTDRTVLSYMDRQLFDTDLNEIMQRPQHQLDAWIQSVESAVRMASRSATTITDPTQPCLPFAQQPPPRDRQDDAQTTVKKIPTSRNSPHLTPVQLRIARRRYYRDKRLTDEIAVTAPPIVHGPGEAVTQTGDGTTEPDAVVTAQQALMPQRRRKRRRSAAVTRRKESAAASNEQPVRRRPRLSTLHRYWTSDENKRRMLQGSWKPP